MIKDICVECGTRKSKFISSKSKTGEYVGDALMEVGLKSLYKMGRLGLSQAIKSNTSKPLIKEIANKYINQGIDSVTSNLSQKIAP